MQHALRSFFMASIVLAIAVATAQSATVGTTFKVLFPFTVGNQTCPSGRYLVERDFTGSAVKLVGPRQSFTWGIHPGDPAPSDSRVVLKFDETGSSHALVAIQYGPLTTSRIEKKSLNKEARSTEIVLGR